MTDAAAEPTEEPAKGGKGPLLIGLVLALVGAGGGFFAASSGMLPFGGKAESHEETVQQDLDVVPTDDIEFIEVPGMVVSFTGGGRRQLLRFSAELEVSKAYKADVEVLLPRIVDVLNGYLRALEVSDIDDPMALTRLRAQMLRRIQIVTGRDMVRDLLIMEFVLTQENEVEFIADILLVAGALGAGFYCFVLSRRLTRFNDLEKGVGGAVAVLSAQVDDLGKALQKAQSASGESSEALADLTHRAEAVAQRLELMMASMHDVDAASPAPQPTEDEAKPAEEASAETASDAAAKPSAEPMFMRHSAERRGAA